MKNMNTTQKMSLFIGILLSGVMALSLIAPALTNNTTTVPDPIEPTNTPAPTLPPPLTDFSGISFEHEYLHSSGLYTVAIPTGWDETPEFNNGTQAQANFNNSDLISVISTYVQALPESVTTLDALSTLFTESSLGSSWSRYRQWQELTRTNNEEDNRLEIDFQLLDNTGVTFLARHAAWFDDNYIYVVRVVMPENNIEALNYMFEEMIPRISINEQFVDTPIGWNGYLDDEDLHFIRYPREWQITGTAPGLPTSLQGLGTSLRVESFDTTIADADAASAFITSNRPDVTILSVEPVSRVGADGFGVAYAFSTPDGAPQSGYAVLLNGEEKLHVANVVFDADTIDLNTEEGQLANAGLAQVMGTFSLMLDLNLRPAPEPPVTPTPLPTVTPVVEATDEATPEVTAEATDAMEATAEATEDASAMAEMTEEMVEATDEPEVEMTEEMVEATDEPEVEMTEEMVEATDEPEVEMTEEMVEATDEPEVEMTEEMVEATDEPEVEMTEEMVEATDEPEVEMTEEMVEASTIITVAEADGNFTTLLAALEATDLTSALEAEGPFTVFAPTDEAFESALEALDITLEELLEDTDTLTSILLYHVVDDAVMAEAVLELDGETVTTLAEADITITVTDDGVVLNDIANVTATDIEADNGVIHVIDSVLLPPAPAEAEETEEAPEAEATEED